MEPKPYYNCIIICGNAQVLPIAFHASFPSVFLLSILEALTSGSVLLFHEGDGWSRRWIWRCLKLDDGKLRYKTEHIPFLEEQVRKVREVGYIVSMDIQKLFLSEENRFAFVNELAAEAASYVENNSDEYRSKKAVFHVLSNRMNDAGFCHHRTSSLQTQA